MLADPTSIDMLDSVRIDKWLMVARVFKTRAQANRACALGRVSVNETRAKSHRQLRRGDRVEVEIDSDWTRVLVVKDLKDRPVRKAEAPELYDDESPPRPVRDKIDRLFDARPARRERGAGRPTKRDRRQLERLRDG